MATKKNMFRNKGKDILKSNKKPSGIANFLKDNEDSNQDVRKPVKPEKRTKKVDVKNQEKIVRKAVKTETRTKPKKTEKPTPKTVREEFRLPYELSEKLRRYAFENKTKKTATVIKALEQFFD